MRKAEERRIYVWTEATVFSDLHYALLISRSRSVFCMPGMTERAVLSLTLSIHLYINTERTEGVGEYSIVDD